MSYHLTTTQNIKLAYFNIDRPRLAILAAGIADAYGVAPDVAWDTVVDDIDQFDLDRDDFHVVQRITRSVREYVAYMRSMELTFES